MIGVVQRSISSTVSRHERRVRPQSLELFGVLHEREHPLRDRGARRLVAGEDEQLEEVAVLGVRERLAVHLGSHEARDQVVARIGSASCPIRRPYSKSACEAGLSNGQELERRGVAVRGRVERDARRSLDEVVRQLDHEGRVLGGDAEDRDDHVDRQRGGHQVDEVASALGGERVQEACRDMPRRHLVLGDLAGSEGRAHEAPQAGVLGRVGLDEGATRLERVRVEIDEEHVLRRGRVRIRRRGR